MTNVTPYRCLALDDELYATQVIETYLTQTPDFTLVKATTDVYESIRLVNAGLIDLVFLDIQMPELTGLQFMKICGETCKVILTTAYPDYALEGFNLDAVDYLIKPIEFERFQKALSKFLALQGSSSPNASQAKTHIFLKGDAKHTFHRVAFSDILYIEGLNNYISVYTTQQRIVTYMALKDILELLPDTQFCRVHRSYIVSLVHIRLIDGGMVYIGSKGIPVSDSYKASFYELINSR
ncbi:LytR/AlgR family response regulator transcription factor [Siphonobacter curvatus]|uniref:DNA-binding response regulator n=1 Tax=Siphonobacter curvatus TaxID=2094562 RepID=A0A2S7IGF4_9BACT|nr:LytTR family DNA-binding domain-containing protein [Siphonobacter curvatus]PQA54507.1 DNA-binding response regulator [Siphonobacter curvatus]